MKSSKELDDEYPDAAESFRAKIAVTERVKRIAKWGCPAFAMMATLYTLLVCRAALPTYMGAFYCTHYGLYKIGIGCVKVPSELLHQM
mmetsp:Transcript_86832/g.280552  ORF Transcript_86832/g.280552 Transcript_86832/m.280552 type:complete len:88 (+) Transcript_86832:449-712(+)